MTDTIQLSQATLDIIKKRTTGDVIKLGSDKYNTTHLSTGAFPLDLALCGGVPESAITLIFGQQSCGKSTTAYRLIASAQAAYPDKIPVFVDLEGTFLPNSAWAEQNGVDLSRVYIYSPEASGEEAVDMTVSFLQDPNVSLVIFDSIPALVSEKRWENSVEDQVMTEFAKLVQPLMQKSNKAILDARASGRKTTLVVINQWRMKAGFVMGDPRVLPGGQSQHFFASLKLELFNKEQAGKTIEGLMTTDHNDHSFKIHKYKVANMIKEGEYILCRNPDGELPPGTIDDFDAVVTTAQRFGLVKGAGQSWSLFSSLTGEELKFKSKKDLTAYVKETSDEYEGLKLYLISSLRKKLNLTSEDWKSGSDRAA